MTYLLQLGILRVLGIVSSFVAMKLVIEAGGEAQWGGLIFLISALNILSIITLCGQENYLLSLERRNVPSRAGQAARNSTILALGYSAMAVLALGLGLTTPPGPIVLWIAVVLPFYTLAKVEMRLAQKREDRLRFGLLNGDTLFYMLLLGVTLLASGTGGVPTFVGAGGIILIAIGALSVIWLGRATWTKPVFDVAQFHAGVPFLLGGSLLLLMGWLDSFLLGVLWGPGEVGLYNVVFKLASIATVFLSLTNAIVAPRLRELYTTDEAGFQSLVLNSNRANILVSTVAVGLVAMNFEEIVGFWGVNRQAVQALRIPGLVLLGSYWVNSFCGNVGYVLQMTGRVSVFNRLVLQATILNVVLNLGLIPSRGSLGASIATGASMIWWNLAALVFIRRNMALRLF